MRKLIVAFCDTDEQYRSRFVTYLMEHRAKEMTVHAYSEPELFIEHLKEKKFDAVFVGNGFETARELLGEFNLPTLWLSEEPPQMVAETNNFLSAGQVNYSSSIFKYQPAESILHEMQILTGGTQAELKVNSAKHTKLEVIGVYSPVCHEMQIPFSIIFAAVMAKKRKILYINFMDNTAFTEVFGVSVEYDMGDIILWQRNNRLTKESFLKSVYEMKDISFIPPFLNPEQLREVTIEDYLGLIAFVEEKTEFEIVIADFGNGVQPLVKMLEICSSVYCPDRKGYIYECQSRHFLNYLEQVAPQLAKERIHMVDLPFLAKNIKGGGNVLEQLIWSEFGDYVRGYFTGDAYESE